MGMGSSSNSLGNGRRPPMSDINVTPFVDVMLVLLVIFMVTAPLLQQGIEVDLPKTESSGIPMSNDPIILQINRSGKYFVGTNLISPQDFSQRISAMVGTNKQRAVYIQADQNALYRPIAEALAMLKTAGIKNVSFVTLPAQKGL